MNVEKLVRERQTNSLLKGMKVLQAAGEDLVGESFFINVSNLY